MRSIPIAHILLNASSAQGVEFIADGRPIDARLILANAAFMPLVACLAESCAQDTMGWSLGTRMSADSEGTFGLVVEPAVLQANHFEGSFAGAMYLRAADICFQWRQRQRVDVHDVYSQYRGLMDQVRSSMSEMREANGA